MAEDRGIARPYAQALFELAQEANQLATWSDLVHTAATVVSDDDVARLIDAPGTDSNSVVELIVGICRTTCAEFTANWTEASNLLFLLAENGRLTLLPDIAELFDKLKANIENSIDVVLTAASPVDPAQQAKITSALKKRLGREVNLNFKLDENLIGGARLKADDLVIDGSVRTGLEKLASTLVK